MLLRTEQRLSTPMRQTTAKSQWHANSKKQRWTKPALLSISS
jgi:hypothetical protein